MIQGLTALYLVKQTPPKQKEVFVGAAAGGVGSLLVQLLKRAGARSVVAAASSPAKLAFAKSIVADHGVDCTKPEWDDAVRALAGGTGPDIIYVPVGVTSMGKVVLKP